MKATKMLAVSGLLSALGVVASTFYIPIGAAKCFPIQSLVNIISGIILGPAYAVGVAFTISTLRILLGTGTLLAYPGSIIGAFLCGILYKRFKRLPLAYLGEIVGTGILGAIASYPIVTLILAKKAAIFTYIVPFMISSFVGATISILLVKILLRTKVLNEFMKSIK